MNYCYTSALVVCCCIVVNVNVIVLYSSFFCKYKELKYRCPTCISDLPLFYPVSTPFLRLNPTCWTREEPTSRSRQTNGTQHYCLAEYQHHL